MTYENLKNMDKGITYSVQCIWISFILLAKFGYCQTDAMRCIDCAYSIDQTGLNTTCYSAPDKVETYGSGCSHCFVEYVLHKKTGNLYSVTRGCSPPNSIYKPYEDCDINDNWPMSKCRIYCDTPSCNSDDLTIFPLADPQKVTLDQRCLFCKYDAEESLDNACVAVEAGQAGKAQICHLGYDECYVTTRRDVDLVNGIAEPHEYMEMGCMPKGQKKPGCYISTELKEHCNFVCSDENYCNTHEIVKHSAATRHHPVQYMCFFVLLVWWAAAAGRSHQ